MIERFLTWWAHNLVAWLPARLRAPAVPDAILARLLPDGVIELARRRSGRVLPGTRLAPGARGAAPRGPVVLLLPPGAALRREVELPMAAERRLRKVLGLELDRLTPFSADEIDWSWAVLARDRVRDRIRLALLLVPKTASAAALSAARTAGLQVSALEAEGATIPLHATEARRWRGLLMPAATAACALLLLTAAALPFLRQSLEARRVEARIQALQPSVDKAAALRRRIANGTAGADVLMAQRATTGDFLSVLALVTDILPDDTHLTELGWHARALALSGQSAAAAQLIGALSREPTVRNPAFVAPVTRDDATKLDRFALRAEVVP